MNTFAGLDMAVNPMAVIDQMPAGREIERLVAERVLGHIISNDMRICLTDGQPVHMPHYSTDIRAAWEVVEHFIKQCKDLRIQHGQILGWQVAPHDGEIVPLSGWELSDIEHDAYADTAPLAICRAALKLVMGAKQE